MAPRIRSALDREQLRVNHTVGNGDILITIMNNRIAKYILFRASAIDGNFKDSIPRVSNVSISLRFFPLVSIRRRYGNLLTQLLMNFMKRRLTIDNRSVNSLRNYIKGILVLIANDRRRHYHGYRS